MANLFPEESENAWQDELQENESYGDQVEFGRSWQFDFAVGDFLMTPTRKVAAADDKAAWVMWCKKAIRTPRYRHLIYSREHGEEFDELLGKGFTRAYVESEIQRIVTETLMVDPRTADVSDFSFRWSGDSCYFNCRITNVRDEEDVLEGSVGENG